MIWVAWRQQRTEMVIAAGILALIAVVLVPTGIEMSSTYHHDGLGACLSLNTGACNHAIQGFTGRFNGLNNLLAWFTLVPGLIGVMLAAPLIGELEHGTYRLAWTQSITRGRWLRSKLAITVGAALLGALALTLLMTWWHTPLDRLNGRMDNSVYDSEGIVVFGYTLFALGLALAVGVVWRRTVPAVVTAFAGYFAARISVDTWLRQHLVTPSSATWGANSAGPNLGHAWVLVEGPSNKLGQLSQPSIGPCLQGSNGSRFVNPTCLARHGGGYTHAVYIAASRFWTLQGIETALFGGTALALILFSAWWVHERAA